MNNRTIRAARALNAKFHSPSTVAFQKAINARTERTIGFWRTVGLALREPEMIGPDVRKAIYAA